MRSLMFLCLLQVGCATVDYSRDLYNAKGQKIGHMTILHKAATSEGAVALLNEAQRADEIQNEYSSTGKIIDVAGRSVEKGKPTALTTQQGTIQSGYTGGYGYGLDGQLGYGLAPYFPGVNQDMLLAEQMWGRISSVGINPQNSNVASQPFSDNSQPLTECPQGRLPANVAEQTACIRRDVNALIRAHAPTSRRNK